MITTVVAVLALLIALAALGLGFATMQQSGATASTLRRHRLGHEQREGRKDPAAGEERRRLNLGAPRGVGERRHGSGRLLPPEGGGPGPDATPTTAAMPRLPRPGQIGQR